VVGLLSSQGDRITLVVAVSPAAQQAGVKAGNLVKIGSSILGGGGGGKDDFAQGGGTDHSKINQAIADLRASLGAK